ncbi:MAG TPA: DUF4328 domain-containing protein [Blastocatellia bacterium]|nr:DUF4328 domain-containing protein [Blastocatellia bacterium]
MQPYSAAPKMFLPGKVLALWTVILLGVGALAKLAEIGVVTTQLVLASNYPETVAATPGSEGAVSEMPSGNFQVILLLLNSTVSSFGLSLLTATAVMFLVWLHRAYSNLPSLGVPRPDFSSGWVIGSWFVPILNLFRPYQIVKYIWNKSNPETVGMGTIYYNTGGNYTLMAWWGFWLAGNILSVRIYSDTENLDVQMAVILVGVFGSGLTIIAACLAIAVVRDINSRQEERRKRLMDASQQQFWSADASPNIT